MKKNFNFEEIQINFKDCNSVYIMILFILIAVSIILILNYYKAPIENYWVPIALFCGSCYYPKHLEKIFREKVSCIKINQKSIILFKEFNKRTLPISIERDQIEKFQVILSIDNLYKNSFLTFLNVCLYCTFYIQIKTPDKEYKVILPKESYSPKDYSLIYKFLKYREFIPNFSYKIHCDFPSIKKEIRYFALNKKRLSFFKKIYLGFEELPTIAKFLLFLPIIIFIIFSIFILRVL